MSIYEQIQSDIKEAMKAREKERVQVLRMVFSELKNRHIETRRDLEDEETMRILQSYAKKREEAAKVARENDREDSAAQEESELAIVMNYLPEPLGDAELAALVESIVNETGASGPRDMGKVIKMVMEKSEGRAAGGRISAAVKAKLVG